MKKIIFLTFIATCFSLSPLIGAEANVSSVQELFSTLKNAFEESRWTDVEKKSEKLLKEYPSTSFAKETLYYLGVSFFEQKDYEFANRYFTKYLKGQTSPQYFEDTMRYKFAIASQFAKGARKHLMGFKILPKVVPASDEALKIFEEVIATLPHHDLAALALFKKAKIHMRAHYFKEALDAYQTLIRRFPQHSLAIESFLAIGRLHLRQCRNECSDPAFLDLAQLNLKKFELAFPGEERIQEAQKMLLQMRERYARDLFEIGKFYEKTKKAQAASLYYTAAITKFPETEAAVRSQRHLDKISPSLPPPPVIEEVVQEQALCEVEKQSP